MRSVRQSVSMRILALAAVLLCAAPLLGGCLDSDATLTFKKDGSGTWRESSTVDMSKAEAWLTVFSGQVRELEPDDDVRARHDDVFPDLDMAKRRKALSKRKGIEVLEATSTLDKKKKIHKTTLAVRFDSLKALFASGAVEDATARLARTKAGHWKLTIRHAHLDGAIDAAAARLRALREGVLEQFKAYWGDLAIDITMTVPTRIIATNGAREGQAVRWQVRFGDLADPKKLVHEVTFADAEGLKLTPFTVASGDGQENAAPK